MVQLSHPYMTTGKTGSLTTWTFVSKVMSLLFKVLSISVIAFLPGNKYLLTSWLQSLSALVWSVPHTWWMKFPLLCVRSDLALASQDIVSCPGPVVSLWSGCPHFYGWEDWGWDNWSAELIQLLSDRAGACNKSSSQQNLISFDSGASAPRRTGWGSVNEFVPLPPLW